MGGVNCRVVPAGYGTPTLRGSYNAISMEWLPSSPLRYGDIVRLKWCKELKQTDGSLASSFISFQGDKQE